MKNDRWQLQTQTKSSSMKHHQYEENCSIELEVADQCIKQISVMPGHHVLWHMCVPGSRFPDAARPCLRWWFPCSLCHNGLWTSDLPGWNGWYLWRIYPSRSDWKEYQWTQVGLKMISAPKVFKMVNLSLYLFTLLAGFMDMEMTGSGIWIDSCGRNQV